MEPSPKIVRMQLPAPRGHGKRPCHGIGYTGLA